MIHFLRKLFNGNASHYLPRIPEPDYSLLIKNICETETAREISPGRKIHEFEYGLFTLRLDRDITGYYRITVYQGTDRVYSFTVFATVDEPEKLEEAYRNVIAFLKTEPGVKNLPDSRLLKGFYYGHQQSPDVRK